MAPVVVGTSKSVAGGSGNTGWSAKSAFVQPGSGVYLASGSTSAASRSIGNGAASTAGGQGFTTVGAVTVSAVAIRIGATFGSPSDNVTLKITTNSGNKPTATVLATSTPIAGGSLPKTRESVIFTLTSPVALSAGTKYWWTIERSGAPDVGNFYTLGTTPPYSGGGTSIYNGSSWGTETTTNAFPFALIGTITPTSSIYQVTQDSALHVLESTDAGVSWSELDAAHAPSVFSSTSSWSADFAMLGRIGVVYFSAANTLRVRIFNCATGLWETSDLLNADVTTDADPLSNVRIAYGGDNGALVFFTSIADTADLIRAYPGSATVWSSAVFASLTSAERSIVSDAVKDDKLAGTLATQVFYYDTENDDFSLMTIDGINLGTEVDLDATVATTEAGHTSAVFQPYDNGSGVPKIVASYIDANNSLQERTAQLGVTSASVTLGTQHQVSSGTSYAGRQLSTCKYGSDLYVFASTATGIDYWKDTGATGTWSSVTNWKTGLTSAALSQATAVDGVGILVTYMDGGNVVIDWAVGGPATPTTVSVPVATATGAGLAPTVRAVITPPTATATGDALTPAVISTPTSITVSPPVATAAGNALAPTIQAVVSVPVATATGSGIAPSVIATVPVPAATASGSANAPAVRAVVNVPTATATGTAYPPAQYVAVPVATATGDALAPTMRSVVAVPVASATAAGLALTPRAIVAPPVATASGAGLAPTVRGIVPAPVAVATGAANAPTVQAVVSVPVATATGAALTPTVRAIVNVPVATATGQAFAPGSAITPPPATAIGAGITPTVRAIVNVPTATATAAALTPAPRTVISVPTATATGSALAPTVRAIVTPPTASATGAALAPAGQPVIITPPTATAAGQGLTPNVRAVLLVPVADAAGTALAPSPVVTVSVPTATASAAALSLTTLVVIDVPTAIATAAAIAPEIVIGDAPRGNLTATLVADHRLSTALITEQPLDGALATDRPLSGRPSYGRKVSGGLRAGRALTATMEAEK